MKCVLPVSRLHPAYWTYEITDSVAGYSNIGLFVLSVVIPCAAN